MATHVGYRSDIRPLFREADREEMDWAFDLWSYEDVRRNAAGILERVADGTMPCDEPWPGERVELLRAWVDGGYAP